MWLTSPESESSIEIDEDQLTNQIGGQLRQEQELQPVTTAEQPAPTDQTEQDAQQQQEEEEERKGHIHFMNSQNLFNDSKRIQIRTRRFHLL